MSNSTYSQLFRLILLLLVGGFFGHQFGNFLIGIIVVLLIEVISQIYFFNKLSVWLNKGPSSDIPTANNLWTSLMNNLYKVVNKLKDDNKQLNATIDYFQESFHVIDDAVIIIDNRGLIVWVNHSADNIFGINLKNDKGELLNNLVRDPNFISYINSNEYSNSIIIPSTYQNDKNIEIKATRFFKDHTLVFARDVTENIKLEEMRRKFISNISHELKTPLTVITGYLEAIKDSDIASSKKIIQAVDNMTIQSDRMNKIIQDLIHLTKLEKSPHKKNHDFFSIDELIQSIKSDLSIIDNTKSLKIEYLNQSKNKITSDQLSKIEILGDYQELRSAFTNLAENAFKYSPEKASLVISLVLENQAFIINFKDNGFGIEAKHIPKLTKRFYRVDDSRSSKTGGTGLGLSIVKHILINHNASLEINSELGVGSTFSCIFPSKILRF